MDVLDLPALNLSESDSSDSESDNVNQTTGETLNEECEQGLELHVQDDNSLTSNAEVENQFQEHQVVEETKENEKDDNHTQVDVPPEPSEDLDSSNSVIQNIWDNFKNYQATKEKLDNLLTESEKTEELQSEETVEGEIAPEIFTLEDALRDHDYCLAPIQTTDTSIIEVSFFFEILAIIEFLLYEI